MLTRKEINEKLETQLPRLKYFRELHGLTIDKVCHDTGINKNTYIRLEKVPVKKGTVGIFMTLAEYYGTSLDYIIGNDVEPTHMTNYMTKRMLDELRDKKLALEKLKKGLDENKNYPLNQITDDIIETLQLSNKKLDELRNSTSYIAKSLIDDKLYKIYPYNLLIATFGLENVKTDIYLTNDIIEELEEILEQHLTKNQTYVMKLRFINELTLEEVSKIVGVTRERVRQIEAVSLRKLRHVVYAKNLTQSSQIKNKQLELENLEKKLNNKKAELNKFGPIKPSLDVNIINMPLKIRSYNALIRNGVDTVGQILKVIHDNKLFHIRNIGINSINDIINTLKESGYLDKKENETLKPSSDYSREETIKRLKEARFEVIENYNF